MRRLVTLALVLAACGGGDGELAAPPPPGGLIVFASNRDGDFDIYVVQPDGKNLRQLTHDEATERTEADDDWPAWSPDGRMIAFTSTRDHAGDGDEKRDVYVMDADGSDIRRLTENNAAERSVDWLRDGRIAFWRCPTGGVYGCSLVAIEPDGDAEKILFEGGNGITTFSATRGGNRIAYARTDVNASTLESDIYVSDLDGRNARRIARDGGDPKWSPDGSRIAFVSARDEYGTCFFHDCVGFAPELYVMNADGTAQRRLTQTKAYDVAPSWSPDGSRLVFARLENERGDFALYVIAADGGSARQIVGGDGWNVMPDWSR